jgi:hypothetical protein
MLIWPAKNEGLLASIRQVRHACSAMRDRQVTLDRPCTRALSVARDSVRRAGE